MGREAMAGDEGASGKFLLPRECLVGNALRHLVDCWTQLGLNDAISGANRQSGVGQGFDLHHRWRPITPMLDVGKNLPDSIRAGRGNELLHYSHGSECPSGARAHSVNESEWFDHLPVFGRGVPYPNLMPGLPG